jgi:multiple sugar transport system permease protein
MFYGIRAQKRWRKVVAYILLFFFVVIVAFPLYWNVLTSLRTPKEVYQREGMLTPDAVTLENYVKLFDGTQMLPWLVNTTIVTLVATFVSLVAGIFAAYAMARLRFRGGESLGKIVLFLYLLPQTLLFIPLFVLLNDAELLNTRAAFYLTYPTLVLPFITWLLLGYFKGLPVELEDAARIDGCSRVGVLYRIILPLAAPGIIAAAVFSITNLWNEFLYALVFVQSDTLWTVQIGLRSFQLADTMLWGLTMAGAVVTTVPPVLVYMLLQRFVVGGLTLGAVKG